MKIPGYAEAAGDRLIFAPAIFQKGVSPLFKNSSRKWPISFPYASRTVDEVAIKLPPDYELDSPSAPQSFGKADDPFRSRYKISLHKADHTLNYSRELVVADQGVLTIPSTAYASIKRIFDTLVNSDGHTLVIKPREIVAIASPVPAGQAPNSEKP
jgi:hypothetical protein